MSSRIKFSDYVFTVTTLTEFGGCTPLHFEIKETGMGIKARATACALYGDSRRPYDGQIVLTIERTASDGLKWQVNASMQHPIKGIKVKVDPVPGTSLLEAGGNIVEIEDGKGYTTVFSAARRFRERLQAKSESEMNSY